MSEDKINSYFTLHRLKGHKSFRLNTHGRDLDNALKFYIEMKKRTKECFIYVINGLTGEIQKVDTNKKS